MGSSQLVVQGVNSKSEMIKKRKRSAYNSAVSEVAKAYKNGELPDVGDDPEKQRALASYITNQEKNRIRWAGREYAICTISAVQNPDEFLQKLNAFVFKFPYVANPLGSSSEDRFCLAFLRGEANPARIKRDMAKFLGIDMAIIDFRFGTADAARSAVFDE